MKKTILGILLLASMYSCTEESRAKKWGGSFDLKLAPNEELLNITWKGDDLWYLVRDTKTGVMQFKEHSSYGIWEGEITIDQDTPEKTKTTEKYSWEK